MTKQDLGSRAGVRAIAGSKVCLKGRQRLVMSRGAMTGQTPEDEGCSRNHGVRMKEGIRDQEYEAMMRLRKI